MEILSGFKNIAVSGIYIITNRTNGKRYVGSSKNCLRRYREHTKSLRGGKHPNVHLQAAYDRYGEATFLFEVIEEVEEKDLLTIEQQYLEVLCAADARYGYNLSKLAGKVDWSEERGLKVSQTKKGRPSPLKGCKRLVELGATISASKKASGYRHSEETRAKQRAAFERNREKRLAQLARVWESRRTTNSH